MSEDVKDFAYYAAKAEQYVKDSFLEEDAPGQRSRYIARAQVFATLATGAPRTEHNDTSRHCAGRLVGPTPDLYYRCIKYAHSTTEPHEAPDGAIFRD